MKINGKKEFYKLHKQGKFGNRALRWETLQELKISNYSNKVCIRGLGIPRNAVKYNIPQDQLAKEINNYANQGIPLEKLKFNESMPDKNLLLQGEIKLSKNHIDLTYTTVKKPMNLGFEEEQIHTNGLTAINILKANLCPSSYADLQILLSEYPDSVIEFSTYSCPVGNIRGRNTVIWEVRNY